QAIGFGEYEGHRPVQTARWFGGKVIFYYLLDLLLPVQTLLGGVRNPSIQTQPNRVTIAKKIADRFSAAKLHVLALVVFQQQLEPRAVAIEMKPQIGLGKSGGEGLARFQLEHLVGQVVRSACVGSREAQSCQSAGYAFTIEQCCQCGLANTAMTKN